MSNENPRSNVRLAKPFVVRRTLVVELVVDAVDEPHAVAVAQAAKAEWRTVADQLTTRPYVEEEGSER